MSSDRLAISVRVNGRLESATVQPRMLLSDFLRHEIGLTGLHVGCEHGVCGACTVLLDDEPVRSCLMFAAQVGGADIVTIEGLSNAETLHPMQRAFQRNHGLQCGFCTPGMVLTAVDLLRRTPDVDERAVREALSGNLCRCTGYEGIVAAVLQASDELRNARESKQESEEGRNHD
jgi:carbon-monoxide dehydrogenase small subunit